MSKKGDVQRHREQRGDNANRELKLFPNTLALLRQFEHEPRLWSENQVLSTHW
jgi:hypothetical protein